MRMSLKLLAVASAFGVAACDVDQTREAEAPDVDVNVDAGQLPRYDVDGPEVNVGTENVVVQVPDVDISAPEDDERAPANRQ